MPTNNIMLFDENKTNMLTDVDYRTNAQRLNGVQSGVASSQLQNKTLYQTSLISYAIAQFMNEMGFDASDSGAVSTFVNNLSSSIKKPADSDVKYVSQTLNDAQRTQARKNIEAAPNGFGLGIIDWNVAPESDANKIPGTGWFVASKNVPKTGNWFIRQEFDGPSNNDALQTAWPQNLDSYHRGCLAQRYQISGTWSPWEWVNPPMKLGVEYRTTERYLGKPVYVKLINLGNLPNKTEVSVQDTSIGGIDHIVDFKGEFINSSGTPFLIPYGPDYVNSGKYSAITTVVSQNTAGTGIEIRVYTTADYSSFTATVLVKYTKVSD